MGDSNKHTWQEIISQPQVWQATLETFDAGRAALQEFLERGSFAQAVAVGCGSTHYLAQATATTLTRRANLPTRPLPSSELWLFPSTVSADHTLLIAISRSGTTTETLRALESFQAANGGQTLTVTCYPQSPLAKQSHFALVAPEAQEQSVAQTRSFTSMLLLTQALAATLAGDEEMLQRLHHLPQALEGLLTRLGDMPQQVGTDQDIEQFFFLGGGPLYGVASEAMLKTKEMSLSHAEAYYPLEFRHGPMSVVTKRTLVVGFLSDTGLSEEIRLLKEMQGLGARVLALIEDGAALSGWQPDYTVELQSGLDEWERGPLYMPVVQLMACHRAMAKGLNPDRPHNLKAVIELN